MKRDIIYWNYFRQQLFEQVVYLSEEERKLAEHNVNLITANKMAHAGHSANEIHQFLSSIPQYTTHALHMRYLSGGDVPVVNYVRQAAIKAFNIDNGKVHSPKFEGQNIHDNVVTPAMLTTIKSYRNFISPSLDNLPDELTVYRGVGIKSNINDKDYIPHALESWTTDIESARKFANMSHMSNTIPHIFKATIRKEDIFASHHAHQLVPHIIPPEHQLEGKEEIIPLGDKLKNIERIE